MSDIDTAVVVDGLKALDPKWPIREADIASGLDQTVCDTRPKGRKFSRVLSQVLSTDAPHQIPSIFKTPPILPLARRMPVVSRVI